ncbi:hypothetical protein SAMN02745146_0886 [Hymenobacter daecheongensis DSM 21074]|uniref:Uncharacterized protein n=1 Tax=Hymenobacter daecheongensis DSM 21074 TaxID=1121955 RepID=A0A1M6B659_9BACT|nr:hypothetical protein [Hymenobacter daecheongensis]SHI44137.1 hypothetical protein SAMN02745146_0886 [Hymenobacter daecheongensis DSM 21074]
MAELHNPLFEDEKEFLERQKLEYERALLGDVDNIKEKGQQVGKYALIGAGLAGTVWLIAKALGKKKPAYDELEDRDQEYGRHLRPGRSRKTHKGAHFAALHTEADTAVADDLGFGAGQHQYDRGRTTTGHEDPHTASSFEARYEQPRQTRHTPAPYNAAAYENEKPSSEAANLAASALQSFLQSDTGKMLIAQVSAVLMAYVAKKVGEYLPMIKNPDLATSPVYTTTEPETRDIDFTYHEEADAPHKPL